MLTYAMLPIGSVLLVLAQAPAAPAQPYVPPTRYVVVPSTTVQPPDAGAPPDTAFVVRPGCLEPLHSIERRIAEQQKYIDDAKAKGYRLEPIHQSTLDATRATLPRIRAGTVECEQRLRQEAAEEVARKARTEAEHAQYVKEEDDREAAERRAAAAAKRKVATKRPATVPVDEPLQAPQPNCGNAPPLWVVNHSIRVVEKYLEKRLDDPDSLQWDDDACTVPVAAKPAQLCWTSVCRFRAKNKFGALVRQRVQFWFTEREVLLAK